MTIILYCDIFKNVKTKQHVCRVHLAHRLWRRVNRKNPFLGVISFERLFLRLLFCCTLLRGCFLIAGKKDVELNERILDKEIRVIDFDGGQLGIMSAADAYKRAQSKNLDLVKIAPTAVPPVCKIMDYGKFRFEKQKREKEQRKHQHVTELKEIRLSAGIDIGDFNTKLSHARKFLAAGDKVKCTIRFRGREMAHSNLGAEVMRRFAAELADCAVAEKDPKLEGRSMTMVLQRIAPDKKTKK